jgi:hypothetical protein
MLLNMSMRKTCGACRSPFEITDADRAFYTKITPVFAERPEPIPDPTLCPDCRQRRRCVHGNQLHLYKRTCDATGEPIISNYAQDSGFKVYKNEYWWSDAWDAADYGRAFDFSQPFFPQFGELLRAVPVYQLHTTYQYDENCEYINYCTKNKDCYLIFDSDLNRDCYYCYSANTSQNCADCYRIGKCELCFQCIDCVQCYDSSWLQDCENCAESLFLKNCTGCKNCLMCSNLRNKEYHVENKPVSKETFERMRASLLSRSALRATRSHFEKLKLAFPQKCLHGTHNEDSLGDYLTHCKNARRCFDSRDLWDCAYSFQGWMASKDTMDTQEVGDCQLVYESCFSGATSQQMLFVSHCFYCSEVLYSANCMHCKNVFGCVGLNRKQYCIFNTQYTKEQYDELVPRIIAHMRAAGEWGEFFPAGLSPFAYNESVAFELFPLPREEALSRGHTWKEPNAQEYRPATCTVSETIADMPDTVTKEILACETCGRNYRIIQRELDFLRRKRLPLPTECFLCRHRERLRQRNPRTFFTRTCGKCSQPIQTTYAPDRPETVYCETCYQEAVY